MSNTTVDNSQDILDSRDLIERLSELEDERDSGTCKHCGGTGTIGEECLDCEPQDGLGPMIYQGDWDEERESEYQSLKAFCDEAEGYAVDWRHGESLIRDSYFETYARELAEDIGAIKGNESWPCNCIDWERAASELQADYTSIEWDGVKYWVRS